MPHSMKQPVPDTHNVVGAEQHGSYFGNRPEDPNEVDGYTSANSSLEQDMGADNGELKNIFDHFDEDKDGKISREEMSRTLEKLGLSIPIEELAVMINSVDINSDGFVDFSEFASMYYDLLGGKLPGRVGDSMSPEESDLKEAFQVFDRDGDGFISPEELFSVLSSMGLLNGQTLRDCRKMITKVDADGNGRVDFEEFKIMMNTGLRPV